MTKVKTDSDPLEPNNTEIGEAKYSISHSEAVFTRVATKSRDRIKDLSRLIPSENNTRDNLEEQYKRQSEESDDEFIQRVKNENSEKAIMVDVNKREIIDASSSFSELAKDINLDNLDQDNIRIVRNYDETDNNKSRRFNSTFRN